LSLTRAELKNVRTLQTAKGRRATGLFLAEGVRLLEEALRFDRRPEFLCYAPSVISERAQTLLDRFRRVRVTLRELSAADLGRLAGVETSQGLLGVFQIPERRLPQLWRPAFRNILLCENLADPGNVGTLWRSALAFGFELMILTGSSADPYAPKTVRSSVGAVFGLPVAETDRDEVTAMLKDGQTRVLATTPRGASSLKTVLKNIGDKPLMLMVGSEADGLSERLLASADERIRIEHRDDVESLNSAVAGSILMKECFDFRERRKS